MADTQEREFPEIPGLLCKHTFPENPARSELAKFSKLVKLQLEKYGLADCVIARRDEEDGRVSLAVFPCSPTQGTVEQKSNLLPGAIVSKGSQEDLTDAVTRAAAPRGAPRAVDAPGLSRGLAPASGGMGVGPKRRK